MLNFDMVGRMRNDRLNVGGVESGGGLRALVERVTGGDRLDLVLRDSPYGPSDHASFYAAGVPVLFFHTGGHDDYHAPGDTADKINAAGMAEVARLGLRIAERLGGEARPAYVALARPDGFFSGRERPWRRQWRGVPRGLGGRPAGVGRRQARLGHRGERSRARGAARRRRDRADGRPRPEPIRGPAPGARGQASGRCGGARLSPRRGGAPGERHPRRPPLSGARAQRHCSRHAACRA